MISNRIPRTIDESGLEIIDLDYENIRDKGSSWKRARELKEKKAHGLYGENSIIEISSKFDNPRDKALFVLGYICAGRISELVRYNKITWPKKQVIFIKKGKHPKKKWIQDMSKPIFAGTRHPSIKKEDIEISEIAGRKTLKIRLRNLKNKNKDERSKIIPLPLDSETNIKFYEIIYQYINVLEQEEELFPIGSRHAERIISKVTNWNPHFLRSLRLTHLAKRGFSDQELKVFAGWSDSRPSKHYIKMGWEDLIKKM